MTTIRTLRTAGPAAALSLLLAGLALGASATASATPQQCLKSGPAACASPDRSTDVGAPPCVAPRVCMNPDIHRPESWPSPPELTGSNSGSPSKPTNLVIWGDHFTPGGTVHVQLFVNWQHDAYWQGNVAADSTGRITVVTSRGTDNTTADNGYAVALDMRGRGATSHLPVAVYSGRQGGSVPVDNG